MLNYQWVNTVTYCVNHVSIAGVSSTSPQALPASPILDSLHLCCWMVNILIYGTTLSGWWFQPIWKIWVSQLGWCTKRNYLSTVPPSLPVAECTDRIFLQTGLCPRPPWAIARGYAPDADTVLFVAICRKLSHHVPFLIIVEVRFDLWLLWICCLFLIFRFADTIRHLYTSLTLTLLSDIHRKFHNNFITQIIHVWYIYLQNWVIYGVSM